MQTAPESVRQQIQKTTIIQAEPSTVWRYLTDPNLMKQWMGEPEMELDVITDWKVENPIIIRGFHHVRFENKGYVLHFVPERILKYDYLSSISRLPDEEKNRTVVEFTLVPIENRTSLTLTLSNFPTEAIFKHVSFYWTTTIDVLKKAIEGYQ